MFFELHDLGVRPDAGVGRLSWLEIPDDGSTKLTVGELYEGRAALVNTVEPPDGGAMEPAEGELSAG